MSDLVERLRKYRIVSRGAMTIEGACITLDICTEAADEIERLECSLAISKGKHKNAIREIERLRGEVDAYQQQQDEIIVALGSQGILPSEIVQRIERLRAALERNVQERRRYKHIEAGHHCGWRVIAEAMIERSREALRND